MMPFATLRVSYSPQGIEYELQLPEGVPSRPIRDVVTHRIGTADLTDLQALAASLLHTSGTEAFAREAKAIGEKLYNALIPHELGVALRTVRVPLLVSVPRDGLPFELFYSDEFWGLRYALGKEIRLQDPTSRHPRAVRSSTRLRALIVCSDPRKDLTFVDREAERVLEILRRAGADVRVLGSREASIENVRRRLAEGYDVIHYCGHIVRIGSGTHGMPGLLLAGERVLSCDEVKTELDGRPFVFLNGCASARNATDNGMWAEDIYSVAYGFMCGGARAVAATASSVGDACAAEMAVAFYNRALAGHSLGEALRLARVHGRSIAPHSATWLSFELYGNPGEALHDQGGDSLSGTLWPTAPQAEDWQGHQKVSSLSAPALTPVNESHRLSSLAVGTSSSIWGDARPRSAFFAITLLATAAAVLLMMRGWLRDEGLSSQLALGEAGLGATVGPNAISVIKFVNLGTADDKNDWMGEALKNVFEDGLLTVQTLHTIPNDSDDVTYGAQQVGPAKVVIGSFTVDGTRVRMHVSVFDQRMHEVKYGAAVEGDLAGEQFPTLSTSLLFALLEVMQIRLTDVERNSIRSSAQSDWNRWRRSMRELR